MKNTAAQAITPAQSRDARRSLGLSQSQVIQQSKLPGHKLKNFETGRYQPEMTFLKQLNDFYSALGVDLPDDDIEQTPAEQLKPGAAMVRTLMRPCFFVSDKVSPELLDSCLERMHVNDERIKELLATSLKTAMFSDGHHEETVAQHNELFAAMAENYLIFRILQGNPIVEEASAPGSPTSTHADLLGQFYAQSPIAAAAKAGKKSPALDEEEEEEGAQ